MPEDKASTAKSPGEVNHAHGELQSYLPRSKLKKELYRQMAKSLGFPFSPVATQPPEKRRHQRKRRWSGSHFQFALRNCSRRKWNGRDSHLVIENPIFPLHPKFPNREYD